MQSDFLTANTSVPGLGVETPLTSAANLSTRRAGRRSYREIAQLRFLLGTIGRSVLLYYVIPAAGVGVLGYAAWLGSDKLAAYGLLIALGGGALGGLASDEEKFAVNHSPIETKSDAND